MRKPEQNKNLNWYNFGKIGAILQWYRINRSRKIIKVFNIDSEKSILDVGCGPTDMSLADISIQAKEIVGVDLFDPKYLKTASDKFTYYKRDARDLSIFKYNQFDVGLNFGMLEHIPEPNRYNIMKEMFRVCKRVGIIVPHKYSFIEPHFKLPFFSLYPLWLQAILVKTLKLHGMGGQTYQATKKQLKENYFWLSTSEWESYHPGSKSYKIFLGPILFGLLVVYNTEDINEALESDS